jgi:hypothetical protein
MKNLNKNKDFIIQCYNNICKKEYGCKLTQEIIQLYTETVKK